ncbi:MAG: patatin-like phospholipase family protein [Candidatus Marinimicrobia bacterium]|nr:patatin-like phospholipase family protein [Candidatus Neomarinimicrobiota bacterium]
METIKKIGLALGSGSARGWAHIGVLEALDDNHIPIDFIAGSSIGAFVGAIYSAGKLDSLKEFALLMDWKMVLSYFDVVFPRTGFLDGKKVHKLFSMHTDVTTFDDLTIPVKMIATNLNTGEKVILDSGNIIDAIRASSSIPGVLTPVTRGSDILIDGGTVDPVPVGVTREMGAEIVIAVNLNTGLIGKRHHKKPVKIDPPKNRRMPMITENEFIQRMTRQYETASKSVQTKIGSWLTNDKGVPNIMEVMGTSLNIMQERITRINLAIDPPDVLIQPELSDLSLFDFTQAERSIQEGYDKTMAQMESIKELLEL